MELNHRPLPCQGSALPLSHAPTTDESRIVTAGYGRCQSPSEDLLPEERGQELDAQARGPVPLVEDRVRPRRTRPRRPCRCRRASPWPGGPRGRTARPGTACRRRGRSPGSMASRSKLTWIPAVPSLARLIASSITARIPRSSMSRMVKAPMPEARTLARSAVSTSRRPTSAAREPSTIGQRPARLTRLGRTEAERRRQRHPVDVPAWGSSRRCWSRRGRRTRRGRSSPPRSGGSATRPAIVPMAMEWSPPRTTGNAALLERLAHAVAEGLADLLISFRYLSRGSPGPCVSGIDTCRSPGSSTS